MEEARQASPVSHRPGAITPIHHHPAAPNRTLSPAASIQTHTPETAHRMQTTRPHSVGLLFRLYLLFVAVVTGGIGLNNLRLGSDWAIADWLINYTGGFVRRGLTGQLALALASLHLSPSVAILLLQYLLYAAILISVWQLLRNTRWTVWLVALVFSPATLAFQVLDPSFGFRKDILFLAELAILLLLLRRRPPVRDLWITLYLCLFSTACILSHEGLVAYIPYLVAALAIALRDLRRTALCAIPVALCSLAAAALVSRFPGTLQTSQTVCRSLGYTFSTAPGTFCSGAIAYLSRDPAYARAQVLDVIRGEHYATLMPRLALLALLPVILAAIALWRIPSLRRDLLAVAASALLSFAASAILFVYGTDWTRWIYLHAFSLALLLLFLNDRQQREHPATPLPDPYLPPAGIRRLAVFALLALYLFGWDLAIYQPRIPLGGLIHYVLQQRRTAHST